ncbi:MAG: hypothetical protein IT340_19380 [Chloroflexi bacterium]|nr:hypothetical protein [Chloroflexota bacterium]
MEREMSGAYRQVLDQIAWSQAHGYGVFHLTDDDVALGRLFAYAFRTQTVGAFRAARMLLDRLPAPTPAVARAISALRGLEELSLVPVPADVRAVVGTVAAYDRGLRLARAALDDHLTAGQDDAVALIRERLVANLNRVTGGHGLWTASDLDLPEQGTFKVPGITVVIVPLVYGDFHSWNNALVVAGSVGQTTHRHQQGVEIHLGYAPLHGRTLLGDHATTLREGYAMPIPPLVDHGFDNLAADDHLVPFVFGSLRLGGWGIFADVEPRLRPYDDFAEVPLDAPPMNGSVLIDRAIATAAGWPGTRREVLIPAARTATPVTGGLELAISRVDAGGRDLSGDAYRILSVRRGRGRLQLGPAVATLAPHDHAGIPAGMAAWLEPLDGEPLVLLDATIVPAAG